MSANSPERIHFYQRDGYSISTDPARLDLDVIHGYLSRSYWTPGIPKDVVAQGIANSYCFGLYHGDQQIGFACLVTDFASFGYLKDVFVLDGYQGRGLGAWLLDCIVNCPSLQELRMLLLATRDAQEFYCQAGFEELPSPERWMLRRRQPDWYQAG